MSNKDYIQGSLDKNPSGTKSSERWDQKLTSLLGTGQSQLQTQDLGQGQGETQDLGQGQGETQDLGNQFEKDLSGFQKVVQESDKGVIGTGNVGADIAEGLNKEKLSGGSKLNKENI